MEEGEGGKGCCLDPRCNLASESISQSSVSGGLVTSTMSNCCLLGKIRGFQHLLGLVTHW